MAVPKQRLTRHRSGSRRGGRARKAYRFAVCRNCKKLKLPHAVCPYCQVGPQNHQPIHRLVDSPSKEKPVLKPIRSR